MQLRKCCNHPYLTEYPLDLNKSDKLLLLDRLFPELKKRKHLVLGILSDDKNVDFGRLSLFKQVVIYRRLDGCMKWKDRKDQMEQ